MVFIVYVIISILLTPAKGIHPFESGLRKISLVITAGALVYLGTGILINILMQRHVHKYERLMQVVMLLFFVLFFITPVTYYVVRFILNVL